MVAHAAPQRFTLTRACVIAAQVGVEVRTTGDMLIFRFGNFFLGAKASECQVSVAIDRVLRKRARAAGII